MEPSDQRTAAGSAEPAMLRRFWLELIGRGWPMPLGGV